MRKYLLALVALLALAFAVNTAPAIAATTRLAPCKTTFPLHPGTKYVRGSCGQHVKDLQWELGGHRPYAMHQVKPTFKWEPNGAYGARTTTAVLAMKYRLGYPKAGECGYKHTLVTSTVTRWFVLLLQNREKRSLCWVGLAARRVEGAVRTGATAKARAIQLLEVAQLGTTESPYGSNRGPRISFTSHGFGPFQASTGAYGQPWCASFQQWAFGARGGGYFANRSAYTPYIAQWAASHGYLAAKPKVGSLVIFLNAAGHVALLGTAYHIGFVVRVTASGVQTIEGNYSNGVHEVWRSFAAYNMVYVNVPGVA